MHVFIDESGIFANPNNRPHAISTVAALVVPDARINSLAERIAGIQRTWPDPLRSAEVRGRTLNEDEIGSILSALSDEGCLLWAGIADLGLHDDQGTSSARRIQARLAIAGLPPQSGLKFQADVYSYARRLLRLSNQEFIQLMLSTEVIADVLQYSTLYYSLTRPQELAQFAWHLDAKKHVGLEAGHFWRLTLSSALQSRCLQQPFIQVRQGDYSHFGPYLGEDSEPPEHLAPHLTAKATPFQFIDINAIFRDRLVFVDSSQALGVQLADVCANALARALKGHLHRDAWIGLGPMLVKSPRDALKLTVVGAFRHDGSQGQRVQVPYARVLSDLNEMARSPLTR